MNKRGKEGSGLGGFTVNFLGAFSGDSDMFVSDVDADKRKEFAEKLLEMLKLGHAIFLIQGDEIRRIFGYDPSTNEWIVMATPQPLPDAILQKEEVQGAEGAGTVQNASPSLVGQRRGRPAGSKNHARVFAGGTTVRNLSTIGGG